MSDKHTLDILPSQQFAYYSAGLRTAELALQNLQRRLGRKWHAAVQAGDYDGADLISAQGHGVMQAVQAIKAGRPA